METSIRIHLGTNFEQVEELALHLEDKRPILLGLDTETTIGQPRISLLQLSTEEECYLFQIGRVFDQTGKLPSALARILGNPEIVKVGVGLDHDAELLRRDFGFILRSALDIQAIARTKGEVSLSLHDLASKYLPNFPGKDPLGHRGNWDHSLSPLQEYYASRDAYYSLLLYQAMIRGVINPKKEGEDEDDLERYQLWIQSYIKTAKYPIAFNSLVNYTVYSYGPWRKKYLEKERREKAHKALNYLSTILPFDREKNKFYNETPSNE